MQITRNDTATTPGPSDWFTGAVYLDPVATPSDASRLSASSVHFTPGARTAWHTHPNGQTIYVLEGVGLAQRRGGPIEVIRPGDRVFFEPGEDHWHGAAPTRFMTHLAMLVVDDEGNAPTWGDHVTDEEYSGSAERRLTRSLVALRYGPSRPAHRPRRRLAWLCVQFVELAQCLGRKREPSLALELLAQRRIVEWPHRRVPPRPRPRGAAPPRCDPRSVPGSTVGLRVATSSRPDANETSSRRRDVGSPSRCFQSPLSGSKR